MKILEIVPESSFEKINQTFERVLDISFKQKKNL